MRERYLQRALGADWMWLGRRERGTFVVLHRRSGVWAEVDEIDVPPLAAKVIGDALSAAVRSGMHGRVLIEVTKHWAPLSLGYRSHCTGLTARVVPG